MNVEVNAEGGLFAREGDGLVEFLLEPFTT